MTLRKIALALGAGLASAGFLACNEKYEAGVQTDSSVAVRTFSLSDDEDVLNNLDSVFFSIDLAKGLIFNADSLPVGTNVTKLVPVITTIDAVSVAELYVKKASGTDTVYDYLTSSTDSVDFTNPVRLRIVSSDGLVERSYTINVNVHKVKADSLYWSRDERTSLPTTFTLANEQRTVRRGDDLFCLTHTGSQYCLASYMADITSLNAATIPNSAWQMTELTLPFTPQVDTFSATTDALYILSDDGSLYTSTDGTSWTDTGLDWHAIYGGFKDMLLGSVNTSDGWKVQQYPSGATQTLPREMPVSGTSVPVDYTFQMSANPQILLVGGRKSDGHLSNATWGFDGSSWAKISRTPLPIEVEQLAVAPYYTLDISDDWITTEMPSLIAMGGRTEDGSLNTTVYYSNDYGYHWAEAPDELQLPAYIPAFRNAQAYVMTSVFTAAVNVPKVVKPIEEWDCPYIYVFGGVNSSGQLMNTVWRGVINRFRFKPVV